MTALHAMTRRGLLCCVAALLAGLRVSLKPRRLSGAGDIDGIFLSRTSAARVGRAFLDRYPEEGSQSRLLELTARDLAARDSHAWRAWLAQQRREELRDEQVVEIDGWVLALSEARLCALLVVKSGWY